MACLRVKVAFLLLVALIFSTVAFADDLTDQTAANFSRYLKNWPAKHSGLNFEQREMLFEGVIRHPVASFEAMPKYDPEGFIGFCFGRAMAVHLLARSMGLESKSIRKVFVIGALKQGGVVIWRFHVTTIVLGTDKKWYAIDPNLGAPYLLDHWMQKVRQIYDQEARANFYITSADAVVPDVRVFPGPEEEKGEHIIEIAFNPEGRSGFTKVDSYQPRTYRLTRAAAKKYFAFSTEPPPAGFCFQKIRINDNVFSYNNYFNDLIKSFDEASPKAIAALARPQGLVMRSIQESVPSERILRGLSIRFDKLK